MIHVTRDHCLEIVSRFEPCPENQDMQVIGIDGETLYACSTYARSGIKIITKCPDFSSCSVIKDSSPIAKILQVWALSMSLENYVQHCATAEYSCFCPVRAFELTRFHRSLLQYRKSFISLGLHLWTVLFNSDHIFSIGFKSGDWNGHCKTLILFSQNHFCVQYFWVHCLFGRTTYS